MWRGLLAVAAAHLAILLAVRPPLRQLRRHLRAPESYPLLLLYLACTWPWMPQSYCVPRLSLVDVGLQLLLADLAGYLAHRLEHAYPGLYRRTHTAHHRIRDPTLLDAYQGSVADTAMLILLPLQCTAWLLWAAGRAVHLWSFALFGALYSSHLLLIHHPGARRYHAVGRSLGLVTYQDHHLHHRQRHVNFGHIFTLWDRLGGTYRCRPTLKSSINNVGPG